jgi:2-phospho-L-lactate guanylyltransferase
MEPLAIVIPLRDFTKGKSRLRHAGVDDVERLIRVWAGAVIEASHPRPTFVACESPLVAAFAREHGAEVILSDAHDLNGAVTHAHRTLARDYRAVMVTHGDLRQPRGLGHYEPPAPVTVVADHHGTGTNVLVVPGSVDFTFAFGVDSAHRHVSEAARLGLRCEVTHSSEWAFDIDEIDDLTP